MRYCSGFKASSILLHSIISILPLNNMKSFSPNWLEANSEIVNFLGSNLVYTEQSLKKVVAITTQLFALYAYDEATSKPTSSTCSSFAFSFKAKNGLAV